MRKSGYISPTAAKLMGYTASEIIGRNFLEFIHDDDRSKRLEMFEEIRDSGTPNSSEYRILSRSGDERWIRSSSRPIYQNEQFTGLRGVLTDISESKRLEKQLLQAQKMEAISTLAGGIAHDFNNLLAVIMGNLSMAREEAEPHSAMAKLLHEIEQASYKARDLTHRFLTLSQGGYPTKEWGSMESLLKAVQGQVQAHEGIEYTLSIQDDLWPVEYDSRQMHYVISNVLINAVEAIPQGGTITIQVENQVIEDKGKDSAVPLKEGKYMRISIKDEGRGIPEENIDKIFDPYFSSPTFAL